MHRRLRRGISRRAALFLLAGLVLVADMGYAGYGLFTSLRATQQELSAARTALSDGNIARAREHLREAGSNADHARFLTWHPGFVVMLPFPDARAVDGMADAARLAVDAGIAGSKAAARLGMTSGEIGAEIFNDGRLNVTAIEEVHPLVSEVASLLGNAHDAVEGGARPLLDLVADRERDAVSEVAEAYESAANADRFFGALPSLLGAEGEERNYLLAFQALGEARATGGLIGFHGQLRASDGRFSVRGLAPLTETFKGPLEEPVEASPWFEETYGPQSALVEPQQTNTSPNFPEVARVLTAMFEARTEHDYDGVFMMDPVALQELMVGMDPITVPGFERQVDASNVVDIILRDSYTDLTTREQNEFLSGLIDAFWSRISSGNFDAQSFASGLGSSISGGHIKIQVDDPRDSKAIEAVDADSDFSDFGPHVQMIFHNNYSANKVDYFLRRSIDTTIRLESDGTATVDTVINLRNTAPDGPPSILLGPSPTYTAGFPPGLNRMTFNALLPRGSEVRSWTTGGAQVEPDVYEDEGYPVSWEVIDIPARSSARVRLRYVIDGVYHPMEEGAGFRFALFPQPLVVPERYRLVVHPPHGLELVDGEGSSLATFESSGRLDSPLEVFFQVTVPDQ